MLRSNALARRDDDPDEAEPYLPAPGRSTLTGRFGTGARLPGGVRGRLERGFGADLGDVRVHDGDDADELGAAAFALGNDISFGAGQYRPDSDDGMFLIAHEVAHTLQQRGGTAAPMTKSLEVGAESDPAERAADDAAAAVMRGETGVASRLACSAPVIRRKPKKAKKAADPTLGAIEGLLAAYRGLVDARSAAGAAAMGRAVVALLGAHPIEETLIDKLTVSMGPQILHDHVIGGGEPVFPPGDSLKILPHEIDAVVGMLHSVDKIHGQLALGFTEGAMTEMSRWRRRPVDFAFLRQVLKEAGAWDSLERHGVTNAAGETSKQVEGNVEKHRQDDGTFAESSVTGHYTIHMRSFAPFKTFGSPIDFLGDGFEGDNRGFSAQLGVTSRIKEALDVDLDTGTVATDGPTSDPSASHGPLPHVMRALTFKGLPMWDMKGTAKDHGTHELERKGDQLALDAEFAGSMPLARAFDIDLHGVFKLSILRPGVLAFSAELHGDGFPNAEVLVVDAAGRVLLAHGFETSHGSFWGPMMSLQGNTHSRMGHSYQEIQLDPHGNFVGVLEHGALVPIGEFNARLEGKGKP